MLIVFEGIDGTGKSSQARLLAEHFRRQGREVALSFEPTKGPHGQKIRDSFTAGRLSAQEELDLFHADRREHVDTLIRPALERGAVVILDRYYFSTMAYQGARGFDPAEIQSFNESFAPVPDHLFLLELPVADALQRIGARDGSGNAFEKEDSLLACQAVFAQLDAPYLHRLDARLPVAELHQAVLRCLDPS